MAQSSPNNLQVNLVVDSKQAKVQLKEFQLYVQKFTKDLRDAIKTGNQEAIAAARTNLLAATRALEQADAIAKKFKKTTDESTHSHHAHNASIKEGARGLAELAREAGFTIEGMKALKFGFGGLGIALVTRQVRDVIGELNELQQTIKRIGGASGTSTKDLKEARSTIVGIGGAASTADTMIESFNKQLDESRAKTQGGVQIARGGGGIEQGADVLRPGGGAGTVRDVSTVLRGGRDQEAVNLKDVNAALEINTSRFRKNTDIRAELARKILAITDATTRDQVTQARFNVTFAEGEALLRKWAGLPPKALTPLEEFYTAVEKLRKQWKDFTEELVDKYIPSITQALGTLSGSGWDTGLKQEIDNTIDEFNRLIRVGETVLGWWKRFDEYMKSAPLRRAAQGVLGPPSADLGPQPDLSGIAPGQASGGYIRGAGSGTSDSILARLSNGEYVINAASTRRLGTGFLSSLNSFAAGGLIGASPMRFAAGGLASASTGGGTPVHLHLGGRVFATTASSSVASALVSEAHRQAITSAGQKPGWYT